jgi:hypothetical protein
VPVRLDSGDRAFVAPELRLLVGRGHGEPRRSSRFEIIRCGLLEWVLLLPLPGGLSALGPVGVFGGRGDERLRRKRARGVSAREEVVVSEEI